MIYATDAPQYLARVLLWKVTAADMRPALDHIESCCAFELPLASACKFRALMQESQEIETLFDGRCEVVVSTEHSHIASSAKAASAFEDSTWHGLGVVRVDTSFHISFSADPENSVDAGMKYWAWAVACDPDTCLCMFGGRVCVVQIKTAMSGGIHHKDAMQVKLRALHLAIQRTPDMPFALFCKLVHYVGSQYKQLQAFQELSDLYMRAVRQAMRVGRDPLEIGVIKNHLAEALEAWGQHVAAAPLYREIANGLLAADPAFQEAHIIMNNCAIAYKRGGCWAEAEKAHVVALRLAARRGPNEQHRVLNDLATLYWKTRPIKEETRVCALVLSGLLVASGFSTRNGWQGSDTDCKKSLRRDLRSSPPDSQRMLEMVSQDGSVVAFRQRLLTCRAVDVQLQHSDVVEDEIALSEERRREALRNASKPGSGTGLEPDASRKGNMMAACDSCGLMVAWSEIRACPCNLARYCDKKCQKAHWSSHKRVCLAAKSKA